MDKQQAEELIRKYLDGTCTEQERNLVEQWYNRAMDEQESLPLNEDLETIGDQIYAALPAQQAPSRRLWPRIAAAASILLVLSAGGYLLLQQQHPAPTAQVVKDLQPGGNRAILTLSGGQQIILTNVAKGTIASQGNALITKTDSNRLVYSNSAAPAAVSMNTLETPRGGTYALRLSDGTQVWLNAASKLVYPSSFTGTEREVTLTGEAIFKVSHNAAMPFHVIAAGHTFRDIGTAFNINAYTDEPTIKATLLEGSMSADHTVLQPGQQANMTGTKVKVIHNVDTDEITAWKDGFFDFNQENLASVMRKVSRWYDVDIEFTDPGLQAQTFSWRVSRYKTVAPLLRKLELTGAAHFTITDKKIIVHD